MNFLFGNPKPKPPDRKQLARWLCGPDASAVQKWLNASTAAFFEELGNDGVAERRASQASLDADSLGHVKAEVTRLVRGPAPGSGAPRSLSPAEMAVAEEVYNDFCSRVSGELFVGGVAMALANAAMAWYAGQFMHSVDLANHILIDINSDIAEAYRIRAFALISLEHYDEARQDLELALTAAPSLAGAKEPLAALNVFLGSTA